MKLNATCAPQDFFKKSPLPHGDKPKKFPLLKKLTQNF